MIRHDAAAVDVLMAHVEIHKWHRSALQDINTLSGWLLIIFCTLHENKYIERMQRTGTIGSSALQFDLDLWPFWPQNSTIFSAVKLRAA